MTIQDKDVMHTDYSIGENGWRLIDFGAGNLYIRNQESNLSTIRAHFQYHLCLFLLFQAALYSLLKIT